MRVLIVEDDAVISIMMEDALEEAGHVVVGAVASAAAVERLLAHSVPGLLLVDVNLADGETGCRFASESHRRWNVPTIFVTGSPEKARVCDDAIGVLVKPFRPGSVSAAVDVASALETGEEVALPAELELFGPTQPVH